MLLALICSEASLQEALVPNGRFEMRGADGWVQGWEKVAITADCTIEAAESEPGNWAVHIVGKSRLSRGGLRAPLEGLKGPPVVRVLLRYRGTQGKRSVILRPKGMDPADAKAGERFVLEPSRTWRPGGGMLSLGLPAEESSGDLEIMLLHEGPGETWFDDIQVTSGAPEPRPAVQPMTAGALPSGPYGVRYCPEDGESVRVNPPRFRWPGRPGSVYTLEWSSSPQFPPEGTQRVEGLKLNVYIPPEPFSFGQWYWRVSESVSLMPGEPARMVPDTEGEEEPPGTEDLGEEDIEHPDEGAEPTEDETSTKQPQRERKREQAKPRKGAGRSQRDKLTSQAEEPQERLAAASTMDDRNLLREIEDTTGEGGRVQPRQESVPPGEVFVGEDEDETTIAPMGESESTSTTPAPSEDEAAGELFSPTATQGASQVASYLAPSAARSFRIEQSAPTIPIPSVDAILASLPSHPRIWVTLDDVLALRGAIAGPLKTDWDSLLARLAAAKGAELAPEPKGRGKWRNPSAKDLANNQAIFEVASKEASLVRDFAFAALISGEQSYVGEAKRRALHLAGWDPKGSTGYVSHDQAFREVLLSLALTLDWLPQSLSEDEKQKIVEAVSARGQELYQALSRGPRPINLFPYSSHGQTALGFLTVAALATVGDIPEAEEWLRFALPVAVGLFSPWAGEDGGWMQGETYWKRSARFTFQLFDALRTATGINLYELPWAANTARYKVYMHPPYCPRGGFGDGPETPPDAEDRLAMLRLASARKDPVAAWYAANVSAAPSEVTALDILAHDPAVEPQAPDGYPPSAAFLDSGLFAMHSSLTEPAGVHLYGRASRFGSFNHAHADQGHFSLYAFGEPLLIDAGYYDWYRSPHATSYARTSLAHNVLLYNGTVGQRPNDITAGGKIETFLHTEYVDYARLQLAEAYPHQLLTSYQREFVFMRPNSIVVFDHVEPCERANFAWLLHSLEQPNVDAASSVAVVRRGRAGVSVGAFGPGKLTWSVNKGFPKNPRFADADIQAPTQWHITVRSTQKVASERLIQLLVPFQGEAAPVMKSLEVSGGRGAQAEFGGWRMVVMMRAPQPPPPQPKKSRDLTPKGPAQSGQASPDEGGELLESASDNAEERQPLSTTASESFQTEEDNQQAAGASDEASMLPPMSGAGLTVDAARLCLVTANDGVETLFADDLKSLMRGDVMILSATSPALIMGRLYPNPTFTIQLKESATFTVALATPPPKLFLDGVEQTVYWADGKLMVDIPAGRHELRTEE